MHIPDGMLDTKTWVTCWAGGAGAVAYASTWVKHRFDDSKTVLMAVLAALIFALQMLNFPVAGGTSGHFGGGVLAALVLGPWPACLVMTAVLLIQAVLFGDGGVTALGASIINMAVIAPFVGWTIGRLGAKVTNSRLGRGAVAFVAAWAGVFLSALAVGIELWASGRAEFFSVIGAMGFWHALIGIGEGAITAGIVTYLAAVRPGLFERAEREQAPTRSVAVVLGVLAVAAAGLSFLASEHPDGLEFVYFEQGVGAAFPDRALIDGPFPDYVIVGIPDTTLAGVAAGIMGLVVTGLLVLALTRVLTRRADRRR